jgi:hypothetical protein
MLGLAGHATHFAAFFATAGVCALWRARQKGNWLLVLAAGLLFGTAVLMKQHAALIALWAALGWTVWCLRKTEIQVGKRLAAIAIFGVGLLLPFALCCLILWHAGVFGKFWFWTIDYARQYASVVPLDQAPRLFWNGFRLVTARCSLIWLIAGAGVALLWLDERLKPARRWLLGFCLASALAVCPDFYFRKHYFLIALPAVALLAGCAVCTASRRWAQKGWTPGLSGWPVWIWVAAIAVTIAANWAIWFRLTPVRATLVIYGDDPFGQAAIVAKYLQLNSPPGARVAVIGSEPEIYFLARRHSATGYLYTYPLMEPQPFARKMQEGMISEIETNAPEFVVFADSPLFSWGRRPDSDPRIFDWWNSYQTNYIRVGLVDVVTNSETQFRFGTEDAARYGKIRGLGLEIFQRK